MALDAVLLGRVDAATARPATGRSRARGATGGRSAQLPATIRAKLQLLFDGQPVRGLVAWDSWAGWADVIRLDDRGQPVMLRGVAQTVRLHGVIRVSVREATASELEVLMRAGLTIA